MKIALAGLALLAATTAFADRAPVLKQIKVPHDYYYREMYLPELTTGPSALAWSPNGHTLVYSMAGSLWKQDVYSTTAYELTAGPGYDFEPDWSPDGKTIVFVRYLHDAEEIYTLDLRSGAITQITQGGDVNLEPRWSPDGNRIAFVSTKGTCHFHIFVGAFGKNGFSAKPWMRERKSKIARYYYSPFDQELSPTWSPDGRSLIYVDNPEIGHGSGALWRRAIDGHAYAHLVHREETNWKAAPDWSRDGKRVVFSSYSGRQTNQIWLLTAAGDDYPFPVTYGNWDATRPRWSPDSTRIAYITNANKNTDIVIQDAVGGARHALMIGKRIYKRPMGTLALHIVDETGRTITARVSVLGSDGRAYAPDTSLMRGDDSFDRDRQDFETHYFQGDGGQLTMPTGKATIVVWYGDAHRIERASADIVEGNTASLSITMHRLDTPPEFATWKSGDVHDHMNYGGTYRSEPRDLIAQAQAEDLDTVFDLVVNKEQRVPDIAYFSPLPDEASTPNTLLAHSQEYHTSVWGHLGLLGLDDHYIIPGYVGYPYTAAASLYPDNAAVADLGHAQHALVGYVHPFDVAPDPDHDKTIANELPVDVALGKVDYYEVVGFSNHRESASIWYRLLNCGFRLPAAGGTDAMTNYASLRGPVGLARVYVKPTPTTDTSSLGRERAWLAGLKAGHSMATNGPLIGLTVEDKGPGDDIALSAGAHMLKLHGWLRSFTAIDHLEVVLNGKVVKTIGLGGERTSADFAEQIPVDRSGWIVLRAWNDHATPDVFDLYPYASTNPVFVTVGGEPIRSKEDAAFFVKWIDKVRAVASANRDYNTPAERNAVLEHIDDARKIFERQL
ncbi:MAG TPA: CehA/McbA family metallohydrolase [Rhizomicrobium sp.]|nr:CehA/McbA family metallohydrolase [Rhizomicrobium sp.]